MPTVAVHDNLTRSLLVPLDDTASDGSLLKVQAEAFSLIDDLFLVADKHPERTEEGELAGLLNAVVGRLMRNRKICRQQRSAAKGAASKLAWTSRIDMHTQVLNTIKGRVERSSLTRVLPRHIDKTPQI
jgi:hypothetical protein